MSFPAGKPYDETEAAQECDRRGSDRGAHEGNRFKKMHRHDEKQLKLVIRRADSETVSKLISL